ncbi:hypothetical protein AMK26_05885 [Streptomyces sp. CB03234]|uniref:hypothetical protein n=1 Tax=Streptomyces sp. (strain CB03234) TaxID=1703937 RepID=UPI00093D4422|nr:hypothetical protein [Streptomyces sp. CB03234]OKK08522.1 hypothetical protein AMK26_05885 [Streptomyces sp. CB03234]
MNTSRLIALGVLALGAVLPAVVALPSGVAYADETHHGSDNGHRISLLSIGQVDDPMEDVLEHVAILGHNKVVGS